ncbi:MAG: sulfatase, partial [Paramuribaculum sp.]|nr:sulfatase [Paramuribaculum sp.]
LLRGESAGDSEREIIWNFPNVWGNNGPGINLNCAIRRGPWKLIYSYADGSKELYNVVTDISETRNLADTYPSVTDFLSSRLGTRLREMNAQRPSFASTGAPCPWPDELP